MIIKIRLRMSYFYFFLANRTLTTHKIKVINNPNNMTRRLYLSSPLTNGDTTDTPKTICPALSKIFDNLLNWLTVNIGFLFRSQFFTLVYDNLEFMNLSNGGNPPGGKAIRDL